MEEKKNVDNTYKDNKEINNQELVDAIRAIIINDNEENRNTMIKEIIKAQFIAPITFINDPDIIYDGTDTDDNNGKKFSFDVLKNDKANKTMFPAFTDIEELKKAKKQGNVNSVITTAQSYAKIFSDPKVSAYVDGIVINPYGMSLMLDKEFFLKASEKFNHPGMMEKKFDKDTKFTFAIPKNQPIDMLDALKEYLKFRPDVNKAYFLLMGVNDEQPKPLIVVDFEGDNPKDIFDGIGKISSPFHKGTEIGMSSYDNDMIKNATKEIEPFFQK